MARTKTLTDAKIRDLDPGPEDYYISVEGYPLRIKVSKKGTKSFVVKFYIHPKLTPDEQARAKQKPKLKQVEYVLGQHPAMSLDTAKELSQQLVTSGRNGIDQRKVWAAEEAETASRMRTVQLEYLGESDPSNPEFLKTAWDTYGANKTGVSRRHSLNLVRLWKHVKKSLPETIKTADLKVSDVGKIRKDLFDRPQEFNKFRMVLFSVLETELHDGRISQNILRKRIEAVQPFPLKYRDTILTPKGENDFKAFFSDLSNFSHKQHNHARFLLTLLYTGQRPSMLRSLLKEDDGEGNFVDFKTGIMHFRRHKTAKKSTERAPAIKAPRIALNVMEAACEATPYSPYVFGSHDNRKKFRDLPLSERRSQELFRQHAHRFEVDGSSQLEIYGLRHTFGTRLVDHGVPLHQVKDIMLHTSILTTQRYVRTTAETRRTLADKIDDIFQ